MRGNFSLGNHVLIDNVTVAFLTKLNELAERFAVKPHEFTAIYQEDDVGSQLAIGSLPEAPEKQAAMEKLMDAIGMGEGGELRGSPEEIYDALERALQRAPRSRPTGDWGRFSAN